MKAMYQVATTMFLAFCSSKGSFRATGKPEPKPCRRRSSWRSGRRRQCVLFLPVSLQGPGRVVRPKPPLARFYFSGQTTQLLFPIGVDLTNKHYSLPLACQRSFPRRCEASPRRSLLQTFPTTGRGIYELLVLASECIISPAINTCLKPCPFTSSPQPRSFRWSCTEQFQNSKRSSA
jgi:hypothetical protein